MYRELKEEYEKNIKDGMEFVESKNLQHAYLRACQKCILEAKDISSLLENSIVNSFSYDKSGVYLTLNEEFGGMKLYIHDTDLDGAPMWLSCFGSYEADETNMVKQIIKRLPSNATIFDVGANIGWYSLMLKTCFKSLNVFSFEPAPENYIRLQRNFRLNNLDESNLVNSGFYSEKGKIDFHFNPERTGASSIKNILCQDIKAIQVEMDTIDAWVVDNNIRSLDFIKCDVEGSELYVFQGGMETIRKHKPVIFSEMLRKWSLKFGYHPNDIIDLLVSTGYECYVIKGERLRKFDRVDDETVETNYFFLHKIKHEKIISELCQLLL